MTAPSRLLVRPDYSQPEYLRVTPASAGWEWLHFAARRLRAGQRWDHNTADNELALVVLGGRCAVRSNRGEWPSVGRRPNVFAGLPHGLYLPRRTSFTLEALTDDLDLAYGWCATDQDHPPARVTPETVEHEIRGGGNATRQIVNLLPPGFDCHRLVVVEVYTPAGNWSSYPPHKHDVHRVAPDGRLLEADLEEVYLYKGCRAGDPAAVDGAHAIQRVYTADGRLDETLVARPDDAVLVPEGYHPVAVAHGYDCYYLNILAGTAQSLANTDDPAHAWIKNTWTTRDPRVPLVTPAMES